MKLLKGYKTASVNLFKWFADNQMKANQDKCHLIVSKNENVSMHIGPFEIKNTNCEKLLGIKVDSRFNFRLRKILDHIQQCRGFLKFQKF